MLRSNKKYKKTTTSNIKQSPNKTRNPEHLQSLNTSNDYDNTNNNSTYHSCDTKTTNKIHFKIPEFPANKRQHINNWFETCTNLFKFNNIYNEKTITTHIINQLPHEILNKINNKLNSLSKSSRPLTELQDILNQFYPYNLDKVLEECYKEDSLGDRKPSEYLSELTNKLKDENNTPNTTLIKFFFHRILPPSIKNILLANKELNLEEQGLLADEIYNNDLNTINNINKKVTKPESDKQTIDYLLNKIEQLNKEIETLKKPNVTSPEFNRKNQLPRNWNQNIHDRRNDSKNPNPYCYYHTRFGDNAFRCTPPCDYNKNKTN